MNKKQLIVAYICGIIIVIVLLYEEYWLANVLGITIIGGLLIYTLRDKKK